MKSVVHRRAYMDYVGVKRFDAEGRVMGELGIVGLFTSTGLYAAAGGYSAAATSWRYRRLISATTRKAIPARC